MIPTLAKLGITSRSQLDRDLPSDHAAGRSAARPGVTPRRRRPEKPGRSAYVLGSVTRSRPCWVLLP